MEPARRGLETFPFQPHESPGLISSGGVTVVLKLEMSRKKTKVLGKYVFKEVSPTGIANSFSLD